MAYRPLELLEETKARSTARNEELEKFFEDLQKQLNPFCEAVEKYAKSGVLDAETLKIDTKDLNIDQENAGTKKSSRRKKVTALAEATEPNNEPVKIKKEKISEISPSTSVSSTTSSLVDIPKENIKVEKEDMPAPNWIPPKKKTKEPTSARTTRTKGKKATAASNVRDSDVIVQNATVTTINLSDTDEEKEETVTRSTRSKVRKAPQTLDSGTETDTESTTSTRSTRTKTRNRKELAAAPEEVEEPPRSTRTKTIRKAKQIEEEEPGKNESEVSTPESRSTRTKTIKKAKDVAEIATTDTEAEPTRSTRTKTRQQAETTKDAVSAEPIEPKSKRQRSTSRDKESPNSDSKKSKPSSSPNEIRVNTTSQTVFEDAKSTLSPAENNPLLNSTFVTAKANEQKIPPVPPLKSVDPNCTMVLDQPKFNIFDNKSSTDLFTDDESIEQKTPPKKGVASKASKEVFSPFEKTTLKKKVEAFEKLQSVSEIPVKAGASKSARATPKSKMFTPLGMKFMPSYSSSSTISRVLHNPTAGNDSAVFGSASKLQNDPRERQRKMQEREQALKKKEAMLQAQADAKRKLNEEKQLKAQQHRKALEVEKQKQLEVQKQKEERQKQREREREEYMQKQKQDAEKKRQAQKKKLQEIQAQRQQMETEQAKTKPIYMINSPPPLPTEDCYDSDDPSYKKVSSPSWCGGEQSKIIQLSMLAAGEKIKNTLFSRRAQTPDLSEIFENIEPRKLKRSSSILWKKPPRYTMMPDLNETKFSGDEELYESD